MRLWLCVATAMAGVALIRAQGRRGGGTRVQVSQRQTQRGGGGGSQSQRVDINVGGGGRRQTKAKRKSSKRKSSRKGRGKSERRGRGGGERRGRGRSSRPPRLNPRSRGRRFDFDLIDPRGPVQRDRPQGAPPVPQNSPQVQGLLMAIQAKAARKAGVSLLSDDAAFQVLSDDLSSDSASVEDDGTELSRNYDILGLTLEGDIVLDKPQAISILSGSESRTRFKRKLIGSERYRWTRRTVPYKLASSGGQWETAIRAGVREWEENTCLRFVPRSSETDYLYFQYGQGCYSNVGRVGGPQTVSIGARCDIKGIVAHEIGHALGFWHEQSRPDRDSFVYIEEGNILSGTQGNFLKQRDVNDYGNPYDYGSVMHYGSRAFTRSWNSYTIVTRDSNYQETIGQRNGLSFVDVKIVNDAYCADVCGASAGSHCRNGGYADPRRCSACKCPGGFGGPVCDSPARSSGSCGGTLTATSEWQTISSSQNGVLCNWLIREPNGGRVWIAVDSLSYTQQYPDSCQSYLEIKYKRDKQPTGARFCKTKPTATFASEDSVAAVIHSTEDRITGGSFSLRYRSDGSRGRATSAPATPAPRPVATTTRAPWTRAPTTRARWTTRPTLGPAGPWGPWSSCSRTCGGCGIRERTRRLGSAVIRQRDACNEQACPSARRSQTCQKIQLSIPCSQADVPRLTFNPYSAPFRVEQLPSWFPNVSVRIVPRSRRRQTHSLDRKKRDTRSSHHRRRHGKRGGKGKSRNPPRPQQNRSRPERMCPRTFAYNCSGGSGGSSCCSGYRLVSGRCVP